MPQSEEYPNRTCVHLPTVQLKVTKHTVKGVVFRILFDLHFPTHRLVVLWPLGAVCRTQRAAVVGAGLVGVVQHVHHGNAEIDPQGVDHKEAITREHCQTVA